MRPGIIWTKTVSASFWKVVNEPRRAQHKNHIVMLTAIGMPHHRPEGTYFDRKMGTWSQNKCQRNGEVGIDLPEIWKQNNHIFREFVATTSGNPSMHLKKNASP